ncbi:hypothetical protein Srot_0086 [Segniliparus rotundus DSM 44985]|uniref:Uncharacterized protein n=1 Tax=Segniliparus rotundus (strain ATCC BAA-972 / CDC 1076 / CIP 108378 / DSM 44985 / JCM 13578) TaxID=640132 RepID=D6Z9Q1_SEGRD|nr:hypothetical protein [Segniliparus rotundus]ADG96578.1 hypothetical protein Srot_0086 [Segniliparus rotundus DSM 44985]
MNDKTKTEKTPPADSPISFFWCLLASGTLILLGFTLESKFGFILLVSLGVGVYLFRVDERWRNAGRGVIAASLAGMVFYFGWPVFYISIPAAFLSILHH